MERTKVEDIVRATGGVLLKGAADTPLKNVSIDSRVMKGEDLFVPLIGARSDAHDYLTQAIENGAAAVLSSRKTEPLFGAAWIQVEDTLKALQAIGKDYRERLSIPVIGVTGSVGKTTTREMTAAALGAGFKVFKTSKNFNSDIGLPVTLTQMGKADELAVLEMGMSDFGEMEVLSSLAKPSAAIITNIGVAHIRQLKTRENIFREKLKIALSMKPGGTLILNGDDEYLKTVPEDCGFRRIFYGFGENCRFRAEKVQVRHNGTEFMAVNGEERVRVHLPVMGNHMVMNALAAFAAASLWGISMEQAAKALDGFSGFKNRQQIYRFSEFSMIDDTYNASPDSMRAALTVLGSMEASGKKVAVLADMLELGEKTERFHREVGQFAAGIPVDCLVCIGELAEEIGKGFLERISAHSGREVHFFDSSTEALPFLKTQTKDGNLLLFKGSNDMKLSGLTEILKEQ
ncbi:MAG: UDP-N-acetylmuramoyl-tripeptide--D-alanyl-D-alanine ligase [Lachnospiraceae bacterium]|jgi:UDP-N-acetylmuramoyl-tripeptide--D-alanyl-D-alanine ligase|nr:UDP-N-acetylmuramoyl-tripeptide--D-alanyl-D-alanine ligase [Lachnospiraceae bacterium]